MTEKPSVLQVGPLPPDAVAMLRQAFHLVSNEAPLSAEQAASIRGVATSGKASLDTDLLARLPQLTVVSCLGAGTDGLETAQLQRRGIAVETTSHVLADDVADIAIGLVLALARDVRRADSFVRSGSWSAGKYPLGRTLRGAHLGILGLGNIGESVSRRADVFGMHVGYHNRAPKAGASGRYFDSLQRLAEWSDFLVVTCPGGPTTHHLVDGDVLDALGPGGWLVNVARGSVVDEQALASALGKGLIAGAGLDVFEDEPNPHPALVASDRTILLPHIGSGTTQTRTEMASAMVAALARVLLPEG